MTPKSILVRIGSIMCRFSAPLVLAGCTTTGMDQEITRLRTLAETERAELAPHASQFRETTGRDVRLDVSGRPLLDTLDKFNGLPTADRLMYVGSYNYRGYLQYGWTDCPWPFDGRFGEKLEPMFNEAFQAALYVDKIEGSWNARQGLAFKLKRSVGVAALALGLEIETCDIFFKVPAGVAVVIAGADSAGGSTRLKPTAEGIEYRLVLDDPILMIASYDGLTIPFPYKFELTKGNIPHMLGHAGKVQVSQNGAERKYVLDTRLDKADLLDNGLSISGLVTVNWQEARVSMAEAERGTNGNSREIR